MSKDVIKIGKDRYLINLKSDFNKQSRKAKKLLLRQMKKFNEQVADILIKYGEKS